MRHTINHVTSGDTQPTPADNTQEYIDEQIQEWRRTGSPVNVQIATQIASYFHSPAQRDRGMTAFSHTGTLLYNHDAEEFDILAEIDRDYGSYPREVQQELDALRAYVLHVAPLNA